MSLLATVPEKNSRAEIARLFYFVRDRVRYTRDIRGIETLQTPEKTLEYMQGDCDDQVTLLAAMLEIVGYQCRFVAIGYEPHRFSHVYLEVDAAQPGMPAKWIALDPTEKQALGWEPPKPVVRMVQAVD